ncbi:MAG: VWA domain-containing protein [Pirellulaceae bacterium]|nr:VWA domain-containing protein [Pirellulaceae bacterium]
MKSLLLPMSYAMRSDGSTRRGAVVMLMVIMLPVLLIIAGFAINLSYMELARTEMQIASDAASRAACRNYARTESKSDAITAAQQAAAANPVVGKVIDLRSGDIVFGTSMRPSLSSKYIFTPEDEPYNSVRVTLDAAASGSLPLPMRMAASSVNFQPSQIATATQAELDISLVVDRSGSMAFGSDETVSNSSPPSRAPAGWTWGDPVPPGSRWLEAVVAVNDFLDILNDSNAKEFVGLATYNQTAFIDLALTADYSNITQKLTNHSNAFQTGATNIGDGIGFGVDNLLQSSKRRKWAVRVLIVLTDGIHNTGPDPVAKTYYARDNNVIVYTITFSSEADQSRMQQVALVGSGTHYHATDMASLRLVFQQIARNLPVLLTE